MDIEVDGYPPKTSRTEWGLALSGLLLVLALLALGCVGVSRVRELRCYALTLPLSQTAQSMVSGQAFACLEYRCRVVLKLTSQRGLACFFSPPAARARSQATGGAATRRALQRSSGRRGYRIE
jgi:hypothetical protein